MSKLVFLMLLLSFSIFGNEAVNTARNLTQGKVLKAAYGRDGYQKLFAITSKGAYLFVKQGSNYSKFFERDFNNETALFRSSGFMDINKDGSLEFWYAVKTNNNKRILYVVNTKPRHGKYSLYSVTLNPNGATNKSSNLKRNGKFHKWMKEKVKHLNEDITVINDTYKRPPLKVVSSAVKEAQKLVNGKILKAGFYRNQNGTRFLYVMTPSKAYLFLQQGNSYSQFFNKNLDAGFSPDLKNVGMYDVKGNGFGDFFYLITKGNEKILYLVNTKPRHGKYSLYSLRKSANSGFIKSSNMKLNGVFHKWMKKKIGDDSQIVVKPPQKDVPLLGGEYIYLCDMTTNGKGGYKTGGNYCGISIDDFKGYEVVFQPVYGPIHYIAAHERFKNGTWKLTYKGPLKALRLSDVRKTNASTHINFSVNGTHENYDRSITKVRVYKKAIKLNMPSKEEAKKILRNKVRLRRTEKIINIFSYKENNQLKIAALTSYSLYFLANVNYNWILTKRSRLNLKRVKLSDRFNGLDDADKDGIKDVYYTTVDKRKGYSLLNLYSVKTNKTYTAFAKMGEAIGDFEPEVEFRFSKNTPKILKPWFKLMIYKFGFVKKPKELSENNPKDALRFWIRDNGFLKGYRELQLRFRMFDGDQDANFTNLKKHPVIAEMTVGNIVYRSHYRGIVTAYNKATNKSYIVYVSKLKRNFVTAFNKANNKILMGTQNDGLIIFNTKVNTLKVFRDKRLRNKDIWKILKKGNYYLIFTDSNRAVRIKAKRIEN